MGGGSSGKRVVYSRHAGKGSHNATLNSYQQNKTKEEKKKVFISFSMQDKAQVELLRAQAANERYELEFIDNSLQQPVKGRDWHGPVGTKIEQSDVVIVMIGEDTHERPAVRWEVETAYKNDVPVIPVRIHGDENHKLPSPIRREGDGAIGWKLSEIQYELDNLEED